MEKWKYVISILALLLNMPSFGWSNEDATEMASVFGYYIGQNATLEKVMQQHPTLLHDAFNAKRCFDMKFNRSFKYVEEQLFAHTDGALKAQMIENIKGNLLEKISLVDATNFVSRVMERCNGNMEEGMLEAFSRFNPTFIESPLSEWSQGFLKRYMAYDHPKAKGLNFEMSYPASWVAKEANRPNIVQKFIKVNDEQFLMFQVLVFKLPYDGDVLSEADVKELLQRDNLNELMEGLPILGAGFYPLETYPGIWVESKMSQSRGRHKVEAQLMNYFIFTPKYLVLMQGHVSTSFGDKQLKADKERAFLLFDQISNSLMIRDNYINQDGI
ncbi:MAG: hypothetical protein RL336_1319 [Pseudomonadota bacterium]|jgi:hypothetical protein